MRRKSRRITRGMHVASRIRRQNLRMMARGRYFSNISDVRRPSGVTHEVFNQVDSFLGDNGFANDGAWRDRAEAYIPQSDHIRHIEEYGESCGSLFMTEHSERANENVPKFQSHDRVGNRVDRVRYDPSYHVVMERAIASGVSNFSWKHENEAGSHTTRGILSALHYVMESGTGCPLTMSHASVPVLRAAGEKDAFIRTVLDKVSRSSQYDAADIPIAEKTGATIGMSMTEKQGGSDVQANTTTAYPVDESKNYFELTGHKWFTSAPMSDGFLTLAALNSEDQRTSTKKEIKLFFVPRWRADTNTRNAGFRIQRLKTKLGDRSNASSEIEYDRAFAILLRDKSDRAMGTSGIMEMVNLTRVDCVLASAALQRQATRHALHHTSQREAFGRTLMRQPIMRNVLTDLCVESEASISLAIRMARESDRIYRASDNGEDDAMKSWFSRLALPAAKYFVCKRAPSVVYEAMECHGGNGYVEDCTPLSRYYRQAPLNSIWEGSGNVMCLDVMRWARHDAIRRTFLSELASCRGMSARYDDYLDRLDVDLERGIDAGSVRALVDRMGVALMAYSLLDDVASGVPCDDVADLFIESRLNRDEYGHNIGTFSGNRVDSQFDDVMERAMVLEKGG